MHSVLVYRPNKTASDWKKNYIDAEKLKNGGDTNDLRNALDLFALPANHFLILTLQEIAILHRAELFEKLNEPGKQKTKEKEFTNFM